MCCRLERMAICLLLLSMLSVERIDSFRKGVEGGEVHQSHDIGRCTKGAIVCKVGTYRARWISEMRMVLTSLSASAARNLR